MSKLRSYGLLIAIIGLGFFLRIHDLQAVPLRGDEAFSALYWSDTPLTESLSAIAALDPHPPLAYALFRLWGRILGGIDNVFALRYLAVLGNVIGIPVMFALGLRLSHGRRAGFVAALLWALHPFEIWHSQDFRNYAIWAGLSVAAFWLGLRLLHRRRSIDWLLYAVMALCAALIFYAEALVTLALSSIVIQLCRSDRRFLRRFLALQGLVVGVSLAFFFVASAGEIVSGRYAGNLQSFAAGDYLSRFMPSLMLGETIPALLPELGLPLTAMAVIALAILLRAAPTQFQVVMTLIALPLSLLGFISLFRDVFHPRYVLATVPGFILLAALASEHAAAFLRSITRLSQNAILLLLMLPWFLLAIMTINAYLNHPAFRKAPAWDELGAFLNPRVTKDDLVIQLALDSAFGYYYEGAAQDIGLPVKPNQEAAELAALLDGYSREFYSIYLVAREQAGWPNAGLVERWMLDNMQAVLRTNASGLPIWQFMRWSTLPEESRELARFGGVVALLAGDNCPSLLPSGELLLRLHWKPVARALTSLKTFVHVYGELDDLSGSALWTQDDQYPQDGRLDAQTWTPGEVYRDIYYLPLNEFGAGDFEIQVGWYDPTNSSRLHLTDGSDSLTLCPALGRRAG